MSNRRPSPYGLSPLRLTIFIITVTVALTIILGFRLLPSRYQLNQGEVSPQTIKSPVRATFISQIKTEERRIQAAAAVADVSVYHPEVEREQLKRLREIDTRISLARGALKSSPGGSSQAIRQLGDIELSPQAVELALGFDTAECQAVIAEADRLLREALGGRIAPDQLAGAKERLPARVTPILSSGQAAVATELAQNLTKPNVLVDQGKTEKARQAARDSVEPVPVTVEKGETIVRDGEVVDKLHLEKLDAVGLLQPEFKWQDMSGMALLSLTLSVLLGLYLYLLQPRSVSSDRRLLLLMVLIIGTVLVAKLVIPGRPLYFYLFPVAAAPMLISALLDVQIAILVAATLSILVSYIAGYSPELLSYAAANPLDSLERVAGYFAGSLVGLLVLWRVERLSRFFFAGGAVALTNFTVISAFWLLGAEHEVSRLGWYAAVSAGNGLLAASLTLGAFALLGLVFGITTSLHLLELAQPNQPLLRRLLLEAPGTYHHSIIVGNLAERAAEAIGADSLLVRVGSYYHDIGKVMRPWFFVENQMPGENIHDRLDSDTSATMVVAHVTDGISLAQKSRLPAKIRDFIAEHHGKRLVTYFYHRACQERDEVDPGTYRYPGPRPQTKETVIVMLADSVEAVVRSSSGRSPEEIDQLVDKVVAERLAEGQLDECELTFRDLEAIRGAFKDVLRGVFHPRIEYPEMAVKIPEEQGKEESNGLRPTDNSECSPQ